MDLRELYSYRSRRSPVAAAHGLVASSQQLASVIGTRALEKGGTAADAAVAMAAALQVSQPCSTGLGGDCFCLYYEASSGKVYALNGSGRSPAALNLERTRQEGLSGRIPLLHAFTVTVPGAAAAWEDLSRRFGRLPFADLLAPSIRLAEEGFPVGPVSSEWWARAASKQFGGRKHADELLVDGRAPRPNEIIRNPGLSDVLRSLADEGSRVFYTGWIAERVLEALEEEGGLLNEEDLASHHSDWVQPLSTDYRGTRVWQCPPNGQGLVLLIAANILSTCNRKDYSDPEWIHNMIEALKLGFADAERWICDPEHGEIPVQELLSESYAEDRAKNIDMESAATELKSGLGVSLWGSDGDTVYFCTVDDDGNACSVMNSNFIGFGTGIVPPGCGFSLQNRGHGFVLKEGHPNSIGPSKRPYHSIIPGLLTRGGSLLGPFGVMGGMMQPQGELQVLSNLVDEGLDPQAAIDKARFRITLTDDKPFVRIPSEPGNRVIHLEDGLGQAVSEYLQARGHHIEHITGSARYGFGIGQAIIRWDGDQEAVGGGQEETGGRSAGGQTASQDVYLAGSDPRADGCAMPTGRG